MSDTLGFKFMLEERDERIERQEDVIIAARAVLKQIQTKLRHGRATNAEIELSKALRLLDELESTA